MFQMVFDETLVFEKIVTQGVTGNKWVTQFEVLVGDNFTDDFVSLGVIIC